MDIAVPPEDISISLEIKIGGYSKQCRKTLKKCMWVFSSRSLFATLQNEADRQIEDAVRGTAFQRDDARLYCKTGKNTAQSNYEIAEVSSLSALIDRSWSNYTKTKEARTELFSGFALHLVAYVQALNTTAGKRKRATQSRIQESAARIRQFIAENPDTTARVGGISQQYWAITDARQPDEDPTALPHNRTFLQMNELDAMRERAARTSDAQDQSRGDGSPRDHFIPVRVWGFGTGNQPVTLLLSASDIRVGIGLPDHNLLAHGIFHGAAFNAAAPAVDQEDVDHMDAGESDHE